VKDAQRTKTHDGTTRTLTVIWGVEGFEENLLAALEWYGEILEGLGAEVRAVEVRQMSVPPHLSHPSEEP
jgi:hypothetical protein